MQRLFSMVNDMVEDEETFVIVLIGDYLKFSTRTKPNSAAQTKSNP